MRLDEQNSDDISESRSLLFLCIRHMLIFQNIMERPLPLEASIWAEFRALFRMSKFIIFMQPPYTNFQKCYEKSVTVESVLMSRIQTTFQSVEDYYFYAAAVY